MRILLASSLGLALCAVASAQTATPQASGANLSLVDPLTALQQVSPQLTEALDSTQPAKWKLRSEERSEQERDVSSIHHDLDHTLPQLVTTALTSPTSIANGMAVYRNVDALYDVLLRLQQTAELTSKDDGPPLQDALTKLEKVRGMLADSIIALSVEQEKALAHTRELLAQQQVAPPKRIVADDNEPAKKPAKKAPARKPSPAKPAAKPAPKPSTGTSSASTTNQ